MLRQQPLFTSSCVQSHYAEIRILMGYTTIDHQILFFCRQEELREPNVTFLEVMYKGWPYVLVVSISEVDRGEGEFVLPSHN